MDECSCFAGAGACRAELGELCLEAGMGGDVDVWGEGHGGCGVDGRNKGFEMRGNGGIGSRGELNGFALLGFSSYVAS